MLTIRSTDSLYGRIVTRYFGFGLLCIVLLLGVSVLDGFVPDKKPVWLMVAATVVPLTVLWFGGLQLRRLLTVPEQIMSQLVDLPDQSRIEPADLCPVTDAEPAAAGWNHLLQNMSVGRMSASLESKLAAAFQNGSDAQCGDILNTLSDGVAVTDGEGTIQTANHALSAVFSVPETEAIGDHNILALLPRLAESDSDGNALPDSVGRCRIELQRSEEINDGAFRILCAPMVTDSGVVDSFVWIIRDVTQQKLAEQMRTEFVETATHELRTPLANIRAYAETLQLTDDISVEDQKEFINIINAESTRLGRFVDELLNLSQMDAGSITVSRHETDFERLLQECIENTRPQMEKKQQVFETQIPAKLPHLNLDKDKMASCLVNLLGNAAKYTPEEGKIRLVVEESATELSVRVEDTGFGIAEDELARVFNRFFRSNDDRVREESGSGLGLAYTQEIVRLHGGRLTVDSKLNQGSQFTLHLPL